MGWQVGSGELTVWCFFEIRGRCSTLGMVGTVGIGLIALAARSKSVVGFGALHQ
jgi:hypothetical protein